MGGIMGSGATERVSPTSFVPEGLAKVYALKPQVKYSWYYSDTLLAGLKRASSESGALRELDEMLIGKNPTSPRVWVVLPSTNPAAEPWERRLAFTIPKTSEDTDLEKPRDAKKIELEFDESYSRVLRASLKVFDRGMPLGFFPTGIDISHDRDTKIYKSPDVATDLWKELGDDLAAQRASYQAEASELRRAVLEAPGLRPEHSQLINAFILEMGQNFSGEFNVFGAKPFRGGPYFMHLFVDQGFDLGVAQNLTSGLKKKGFPLEKPYFGTPAYKKGISFASPDYGDTPIDGNYTFEYDGVNFSLQRADRFRLTDFLPALYMKHTAQAAEVDFDKKLEEGKKAGAAFGTFQGRPVVLLHQSNNNFGDGPLFSDQIKAEPSKAA